MLKWAKNKARTQEEIGRKSEAQTFVCQLGKRKAWDQSKLDVIKSKVECHELKVQEKQAKLLRIRKRAEAGEAAETGEEDSGDD